MVTVGGVISEGQECKGGGNVCVVSVVWWYCLCASTVALLLLPGCGGGFRGCVSTDMSLVNLSIVVLPLSFAEELVPTCMQIHGHQVSAKRQKP